MWICVCTNAEVNYTDLQDLMLTLKECVVQLVFSSSATVYGQPKSVPCTEDFPLQAMNPYGRTKVSGNGQFFHGCACITYFWSPIRVWSLCRWACSRNLALLLGRYWSFALHYPAAFCWRDHAGSSQSRSRVEDYTAAILQSCRCSSQWPHWRRPPRYPK